MFNQKASGARWKESWGRKEALLRELVPREKGATIFRRMIPRSVSSPDAVASHKTLEGVMSEAGNWASVFFHTHN